MFTKSVFLFVLCPFVYVPSTARECLSYGHYFDKGEDGTRTRRSRNSVEDVGTFLLLPSKRWESARRNKELKKIRKTLLQKDPDILLPLLSYTQWSEETVPLSHTNHSEV